MATYTYQINYNGNGTYVSNVPGSTSGSVSTLPSGRHFNVKLSNTAPKRSYFNFDGWATSSGGGAAYQPGGSYLVSYGAGETSFTATLYAVWSHVNVYVKFDANGGSGAPSDYTHWGGYSTTLPTTEPTRTGYNFLGWATSTTAISAAYLPGGTYALYDNVTLYAVWSPAVSTVSAGNGTLGSALAISITRYDSSYTHKLTYKYGNATGTISTGVGTSYSWTPPISLAAQFPAATSGTCVITCETFNGSSSVGTSTVSVTLSIPATVKCGILSVAFAETVSGIAAKFGAFVQWKSKLRVTGTFDASSAQGATVSSVATTINGQTLTSNGAITNAISNSGTLSFTMTITDTRGRTASYTGTYNVLAYSSPTVSETAQRVSGTPSSISVGYSFSVSPCGSSNDKTLRIYLKPAASPDSAYTLIDTITPSVYSGSGSYTITGTDSNTTYTVKIECADYFATVSAVTTVAATGNRIVDISAATKTISLHESNPDDGNDHEYKRIAFHDGIILGTTLLTEAQLTALLNLLS